MRRQPEPLEGDEVKEAKLESSLELLLQKLVLIICCFTWDWHFKGLVLLCSFFHTGTGDHGTWIVYEYMLSVLVYMKCFKCTVDFIERFLVEQFFAGKCSLYSIEKSPGNASGLSQWWWKWGRSFGLYRGCGPAWSLVCQLSRWQAKRNIFLWSPKMEFFEYFPYIFVKYVAVWLFIYDNLEIFFYLPTLNNTAVLFFCFLFFVFFLAGSRSTAELLTYSPPDKTH